MPDRHTSRLEDSCHVELDRPVPTCFYPRTLVQDQSEDHIVKMNVSCRNVNDLPNIRVLAESIVVVLGGNSQPFGDSMTSLSLL